MKIIIVILLLPCFSFAQITYSGHVINKSNGSKVPYATVGLIKENIGGNADENGSFILRSIDPKSDDSLIISSVGFLTKKIPIDKNASTNITIQLEENAVTLNDVSVKPNFKWENATLNYFPDCGNHFLGSEGSILQIAQHFVAPKKGAMLIRVKFCLGFFSRPSGYLFRVRVYDLNTFTGGPGDELCDKVIEVKSKKYSKNINLEKYKIRIPGNDFFVALEWLKIPLNFEETEIKETQTVHLSYAPSIGFETITDSLPEPWQLYYNNVWQPVSKTFKAKKRLLISAKIKYPTKN